MKKFIIVSLLSVLVLTTVLGGVAAQESSQLRIAFSWPTFIDPAVGNDNSSMSALVNLYDTLVFPAADGSIVPWVAETWDVSEDGMVWTFYLREDVVFHDGSPLQASDVAYSFTRLAAIGEGVAYLFEGVASAEAVDDYTVSFTLAEPSGLFLGTLVRLYILNEDLVRENTVADGLYGDEGDYGKAWLLLNDAGSGPYTVKDFQYEEYLEMSKFDGWWGEFVDNAPDLLRFLAITEPTTIRTLMANGELEISDQWQSVDAFENLDELDGVDVAALPTFMELYFMMNTRLAPLDDVHCRRAIAYGFDYDTAVSLEWPGTQQSVGPVPQSLGGHNPDVFNFSYDVDAAKEELAQCQYADDIGSYSVEIHWVTEVPDEEKFALLFQANMAQIGIKVEIVSSPWLSIVENTASLETSPHIVMIYIPSDLSEVGPLLRSRYHSSTANTWLQNEFLLDPELDAALDDALATTDQEERYAKYYALQEQIAQLAPSLYVYDSIEKHAYQDYIDWPAVAGESSPLTGYYVFAPLIGVNQ